MAYASSTGRLYSFGLNACGQLGREIVVEKQIQITPAIVKGPWAQFNNKQLADVASTSSSDEKASDDEVVERVAKQLKTDDDRTMSSDGGDVYVRAIYAGGLQCFCLVSQTNVSAKTKV